MRAFYEHLRASGIAAGALAAAQNEIRGLSADQLKVIACMEDEYVVIGRAGDDTRWRVDLRG